MNSQRLIDTFFELVRIDSPSRSEAQLAAYIQNTLEGLGFTTYIDESATETQSNTGNLIAQLPGTGEGHIILSAHMDCVEPCSGVEPIIEDGIIKSAGDTILGADDKAGIAAIIEALRSIIDEQEERPKISILLTTCEELSLLGAGAVNDIDFLQGTPCFVLDADGEPGTIITGSPHHHSFKASFSGRAVHAGVEPEKGVSAIQAAAYAVGNMHLGRLDEHTTANIGIIEGGRETNVVPDFCMLRGECRSLYEDKVEACQAQMTEACERAAEKFGASVDIEWKLDYPGVLYDENDPLIQSLVIAAKNAGLTPRFATSGGGADTNVLKDKGAQAVTLGVGMTSFHSFDEHISVEDLENITRYTEAIIRQFAE